MTLTKQQLLVKMVVVLMVIIVSECNVNNNMFDPKIYVNK